MKRIFVHNLSICQFANLSICPLAKINIPPSPFKGGDAMVSVHEKKICFFVYRLDVYDLLHTWLRQLVDFFSLILYRSYIVPILFLYLK